MTIVIRLKGVTPETGIVEGGFRNRKLDTLIQHSFEADGYLLGDMLLLKLTGDHSAHLDVEFPMSLFYFC